MRTLYRLGRRGSRFGVEGFFDEEDGVSADLSLAGLARRSAGEAARELAGADGCGLAPVRSLRHTRNAFRRHITRWRASS